MADATAESTDQPDDTMVPPPLRALASERARVEGRDGIALRCPLGIAASAFVPRELVPILAAFDGVRTVAEVAAQAGRQLRQHVPVPFVLDVVRDLDAALLLESDRFHRERDRAVAEFLGQPTRPPAHAGSAGYPRDAAALRAELSAMLATDGASREQLPPRGLIAPHIDLARGAEGYAAAYGHLAGHRPADLYVVFGTGHQGPSAALTGLPLDWRTPLGTAATDRAFVDAVHAQIGAPQPSDLLLHRDEHSLEFQVLWLQFVHERHGAPSPRIAAFLVGQLPSQGGDPLREDYCQRLLEAFRAAERTVAGRVCYLAGADLAHLGPFFGDPTPVDAALLLRLERDERDRLQRLERSDPGGFHRCVEHNDNPDRVCSAPAIALVAALAGGPAQLLHYGQAPAADGSQVVTFCAAAFAGAPGR